jgi:hypothetical protein
MTYVSEGVDMFLALDLQMVIQKKPAVPILLEREASHKGPRTDSCKSESFLRNSMINTELQPHNQRQRYLCSRRRYRKVPQSRS